MSVKTHVVEGVDKVELVGAAVPVAVAVAVADAVDEQVLPI